MIMKNKGRILRIKPGYNPNCSSYGAALVLLFGGPIILLVLTTISGRIAKIMYEKHISKSETYETGSI